ncbi:similar to Saccharomyces cerevisiae YML117W NAB6 Putative RNA-binding protein that associates with mRNAs encoding cell wall proteins in high-throughput studies [Maudiozyma saulgeensis]|uniref:Similar to Saccharomyces cerevisiae YML117W NAB6 Putative RNA-binding protein that associates with mRNAs encoding cell wall proteins in high-throughput studies n=1 Tax=Maudiozyma saulgeensis TaxID=1789683 RepID=A0A1X7R5G4_9SACH|nr:similar to Saccharomyces cerevisiae YML117W NAB6 Putative RNA-binding protein that associates with mRNAs encoding cell wall proteins in high-throughput studies [Kazachstania saulgeensis]
MRSSYSRKSNGYGQFNQHQNHKPSLPQDQVYMNNQRPPQQMMYPPIDQYGFQYGMIPPQYANSPILNAPPTPFDSSYGATLLPSHLLMGSPYIASPKMKFSQQQQIQQQQQQQQSQNAQSQLHSFKFNNHNMMDGNSHFNNNEHSTSRKMSNLSNKPINSRNIQMHVNNISDDDKFSYMKSLFKQPFNITFKVLPKGDDVYRTRSLLFENIDKSIDIHEFISNFVKVNAIESVYIVDYLTASTSNNVENKEDNEINQDKQSILLSFFTRQLCLDFYNSVLQRLKEFKKNLKSESLRLSFVSLNYIPYSVSNTDDNEAMEPDSETEDDTAIYNASFLSSLQTDIIPTEATRSITVEFDKNTTKDEILNEKLLFLKDNNLRYIMESIYFVNAPKPQDEFNENYVILTFLNISMANEILNYLEAEKQKLDIVDCFFVSITSQRERSSRTSESSRNADTTKHAPMKNNLRNASLVSIQSSDSNISLPSKYDVSSLKECKLKIDKDDYPAPFTKEFEDHLPNIAMSQPNQMNGTMAPPMSQEMFVNDVGTLPGMSPSFGPVETFGLEQPQNFASSVISRNGSFMEPGPIMNQPPFYLDQPQYHRNAPVRPITDSLKDQMNTSAKIASAMGSDAGNRTIYIGNINPRSKPEDICNVVRGGILQSIRFIESKRICFVTFIEPSAAVQFYANAFIDPIVLHGNTLKLGWGNYSGPLPKSIALAVTVGGSRNVYVCLPDVAFKDKFITNPEYKLYHDQYKLPSAEQLRIDFSTYGTIEQINYMKDSHCCWINFMNISSAIKLVEEANNKKNRLEEKFNGRYNGLTINYGKDRCGNVNRNLVAGKKSRFYNKVKRPSYDIRLSKLEEKRKYRESKKREEDMTQSFLHDVSTVDNQNILAEDKEDIINLASLGITLKNEEGNENSTDIMEKIDEKDSKSETDDVLQDFLSTKLTDKGEDSEIIGSEITNTAEESVSSSEVEFIISKPDMIANRSNMSFNDSMLSQEDLTNHAIKATIMNSNKPSISKQALDLEPPFAPDTISRDYAMQFNGLVGPPVMSMREEWNHNGNAQNNGGNSKGNNKNGGNQRKNQKNHKSKGKNGRTIPGSDVMAQYLAQLQHSTFMYAANVLGASADDSELYEE